MARRSSGLAIRRSAAGLVLVALLVGLAQAGEIGSAPRFSEAEAEAYLEAEQRIADADTLTHAAAMHDVKLVAAVLATGVSPDARGILPHSALQLVASTQCADPPHGREAQLQIIDLLIAKGADVHDKSFGSSEIVIWAAQQCPPVVVERLLDAGANIEARSPQGFSPLSMALAVRNHDTAELLINRGARLSPEAARRLFSDTGDDQRLAELVERAKGAAGPVEPGPERE